MVYRIFRLGLLTLIGLLTLVAPVYAVSVTNALYTADIVSTNTGTATTNVAVVCPINTQTLIDGKYVTSDLLNTALQTQGGTDVPYMPGVDSNPWAFFVPSIGASESAPYVFYAGGPAMQTGFDYFPASGGMTSADNNTSLELGNNFEIEQKGYVDTSAGEIRFNGGSDTTGTSHTVYLPSNISSGNLLLVFFSIYVSSVPTITFPGGWTQLYNTTYSTYVRSGAWYRVADGTEGATITVTTSTNASSAHTSYLLTQYSGTPEGAAATGSSAAPDPPNLTPSWGAKDTLWFAVCGTGAFGGSVTSYPTNYADGKLYLYTSGGNATAIRQLNAASENPGAFTLSSSAFWVAGTVAIQSTSSSIAKLVWKSDAFITYINGGGEITSTIWGATPVSVTATDVSSGEHTVKTVRSGTTLKIYVDDVEKGSTTTSSSVPNNSNSWSFLTNGSMLYMEYHKITIGGTLKQHIVYERDTIFDDLTEYNNDATPTFPTTSSDPDVSATFQNFKPIQEARCTTGLTEETPEMLTEAGEMPPEFYTEGSVNHLPGAELINTLLDKGGIPHDLFWIPAIFGLAAIVCIGSYYFLRSMLFIGIIGGVIILFFALTGAIPLWTFFIYGVIIAGVLVSERVFGW
jgi:hypothetical protein